MNSSLAIVLIGVGIFGIYLEQTGKLQSVVNAIKAGGQGGEGISTRTTTEVPGNTSWRGRTYVTPLGVLNVTDAGTF